MDDYTTSSWIIVKIMQLSSVSMLLIKYSYLLFFNHLLYIRQSIYLQDTDVLLRTL